jgi:hypothetical protein
MSWYVYDSTGSLVTGVADGSITNAKMAAESVDSDQYVDASIDYAHIQDVAANSVLVRDANSSGVITAKALATTNILIGDGTGFTVASLSGQATMDNTGAVTIATLNQSTSGNAATVTTNANLTGHVTSSGNSAVLGSFTSAQLAGALSNETGSGLAVFGTSPTLVTPVLGTPASGNLTNCTNAGKTVGFIIAMA